MGSAGRNSVKNVNGFSPNQLVFRENTNFPTALNSKLPALVGLPSSRAVANSINAMILPGKPLFKVNPVIGLDMPYNIKLEPLGVFVTLLEIFYIIKEKIIISGMDQEQSLGRMANKF